MTPLTKKILLGIAGVLLIVGIVLAIVLNKKPSDTSLNNQNQNNQNQNNSCFLEDSQCSMNRNCSNFILPMLEQTGNKDLKNSICADLSIASKEKTNCSTTYKSIYDYYCTPDSIPINQNNINMSCLSEDLQCTNLNCSNFILPMLQKTGNKGLEGSICAELGIASGENSICASAYKGVHDQYCTSGIDPIVHGNTDMSCQTLLGGMECSTIDGYLTAQPLPTDPNYSTIMNVKKCYFDAANNFKNSLAKEKNPPENIIQSCFQNCEEGNFNVKPCGGMMGPGNACYDACKGR